MEAVVITPSNYSAAVMAESSENQGMAQCDLMPTEVASEKYSLKHPVTCQLFTKPLIRGSQQQALIMYIHRNKSDLNIPKLFQEKQQIEGKKENDSNLH